ALIIDQPLQFPEGVATAEVLKVGAEGGGGLRVLVLSAVIGAVVKIGATGLKLWAETVRFGGWLSGGTATASAATAAPATGAAAASSGVPFYFGINASPALLSVGYIVGFNVASVIFAGSVLKRWIAVPLYATFGDPNSEFGRKVFAGLEGVSALDAADTIHFGMTRFLG